jgi:hypothetical protein
MSAARAPSEIKVAREDPFDSLHSTNYFIYLLSTRHQIRVMSLIFLIFE